MKALVRLFWAVLAVFLFCFALLAVNQSQVSLKFLTWYTPEVSVFWWLLLAFLLGAIFSAVGFGLASMRLRVRQRALHRELDASRRELDELKTPGLRE